MNILDKIVANKRIEVQRHKEAYTVDNAFRKRTNDAQYCFPEPCIVRIFFRYNS